MAKSTKGPAAASTSAKSAARSALSLLAPRLRPTTPPGGPGREAGGDRRGAVVVEAEAVDDRAVLRRGGRGAGAGCRAAGAGWRRRPRRSRSRRGRGRRRRRAFLSRPAARPSGFGRSRPARRVASRGLVSGPVRGPRPARERGERRGRARSPGRSGAAAAGRASDRLTAGRPSSGRAQSDVGAGERAVEVREEGAAARGLPAQRRAGGAGVDGEEPEPGLAGEVALRAVPGSCSAVEKWMKPSARSTGAPSVSPAALELGPFGGAEDLVDQHRAQPCGVMTLRALARCRPSLRSRQRMKRPAATISAAPASIGGGRDLSKRK